MKSTISLGTLVVTGFMALGSAAQAGETTHTQGLTLRSPTLLLADNVVITPSDGAPQGGTGQTTTAAAPAQQTAVVESPRTNRIVRAEVEPNRNYMGTIAVSALMGGLVGVLVGGSIYFLGDQTNARNIGYWGAGGVLLGAGVGVVQVVVQENRVSNATAFNRLPSDPVPTLRLALWQTNF